MAYKLKCWAASRSNPAMQCDDEIVAVIKPSGRSQMKRFSCDGHIVWNLRALRHVTGTNRLVVILTDEDTSHPNEKLTYLVRADDRV
jgi:hypothetical protein